MMVVHDPRNPYRYRSQDTHSACMCIDYTTLHNGTVHHPHWEQQPLHDARTLQWSSLSTGHTSCMVAAHKCMRCTMRGKASRLFGLWTELHAHAARPRRTRAASRTYKSHTRENSARNLCRGRPPRASLLWLARKAACVPRWSQMTIPTKTFANVGRAANVTGSTRRRAVNHLGGRQSQKAPSEM